MRVEGNQVKPLYKHMINCDFPSMAFLGIPVQICPFPMFDFQVCPSLVCELSREKRGADLSYT